MSVTQTRNTVEKILQSELASETGGSDVLAVNFTTTHLNTLVTALSGIDAPPRVRVLTTNDSLKALRKRFGTASQAAELVEKDVLVLRPFANDSMSLSSRNLLLFDDRVLDVIATDESAGVLRSDSDSREFVEELYDDCESAFTASEDFNLRTPSQTQISETLADKFGEDIEGTFWELIREGNINEWSDSIRSPLEGAHAAVLAAAIHEELLYDISTWGEDVGIASRATFSRSKGQLEDMGLIDTEKVPIDIGRPRLRLLRTDHSLPA